MRVKKSVFWFVIFMLILGVFQVTPAIAASGGKSSAETSSSTPKSCGPITIKTQLDMPKQVGRKNTRTITIDENCKIHIGPVQEVAADIIPTSNNAPLASNLPHSLTPNSVGAGTYKLYASQTEYDCCGISMNQLWVNNAWGSYNNKTAITINYSNAYEQHHIEFAPCGNPSGWSYARGYNSFNNYGSSALLHQHAEFSYNGLFSHCDPTTYYNVMDNYETVYANGSGTCSFTFAARSMALGWNNLTACQSF